MHQYWPALKVAKESKSRCRVDRWAIGTNRHALAHLNGITSRVTRLPESRISGHCSKSSSHGSRSRVSSPRQLRLAGRGWSRAVSTVSNVFGQTPQAAAAQPIVASGERKSKECWALSISSEQAGVWSRSLERLGVGAGQGSLRTSMTTTTTTVRTVSPSSPVAWEKILWQINGSPTGYYSSFNVERKSLRVCWRYAMEGGACLAVVTPPLTTLAEKPVGYLSGSGYRLIFSINLVNFIRRSLDVMDGTCLHQFVTAPIKNFLQLQRIKE